MNPLAQLEKLAGWWTGRAGVRIEEAGLYPTHSAEHRRNLQVASDYERRAALAGIGVCGPDR